MPREPKSALTLVHSGIGPRSRRPNDSRRAAKSGRPPSYYEIMAQERERAASKAPRS